MRSPATSQINAPIPLTSDLHGSALQSKISEQVNLLAFVALAQSEDQAGRTLEALEDYLKAADLAPNSDLLQFFIGREYLFSIQRRPIPPGPMKRRAKGAGGAAKGGAVESP